MAITSDICWSRIIKSSGIISTILGTGSAGSANNAVGTSATVNTPCGLAFSATGSVLYIADYNGHCIRKWVKATTAVRTFAGLCDTPGGVPQ